VTKVMNAVAFDYDVAVLLFNALCQSTIWVAFTTRPPLK